MKAFKMRRLLILAIFSVVVPLAALAAANDLVLSFSTQGSDRYADGTAVLDGECYALVWTKDGGAFGGFAANGALLSEDDRLLLVAPVARGGRCPPTIFQIDAARADALAGGTYGVYLLDTRVQNGDSAAPAGVGQDGRAKLVNGYVAVADAQKSDSVLTGATAVEEKDGAGKRRVSLCAAPPPDLYQPKITSIVFEGGKVRLTVENYGGYIRLNGAEDLGAFDAPGPAFEADGGEEDIVIYADPNSSGRGFFKAVRSR